MLLYLVIFSDIWYNTSGKYQIQSSKKEQLIQKINCSECDSFQLYQFADVSPWVVWELYSFQKMEIKKLWCLVLLDRIVFPADPVLVACFIDLPAAGPKKHMKKQDIRKAQHNTFPAAPWKDVRTPGTGRCQSSRRPLRAPPWSSRNNTV